MEKKLHISNPRFTKDLFWSQLRILGWNIDKKHFWSKISFAYWRFLVIHRSPSFLSLTLGHFEVKISQIYPCFSYYFHNLDLFFKVLNLTCAKLYTIFPSFNAARFWSLSKKKEKLKKKLLKKRLKNARKYKNEIINFQSNSCQISL